MSVYLIADIKVTDDAWVPDYAANAHKLVHKHGGRYLARSGNVRVIEGMPPETTLIALIEFPSAADVERFLSDDAYLVLECRCFPRILWHPGQGLAAQLDFT